MHTHAGLHTLAVVAQERAILQTMRSVTLSLTVCASAAQGRFALMRCLLVSMLLRKPRQCNCCNVLLQGCFDTWVLREV